ncbi:MAG: helix-turn-helix transcriptional regulator [Bacteroidota bacterium]
MKGTHLGEFEEIILLAVAALQEDAYGLAIKREIEEQAQRKVTISAVHSAANRLEDKGYLKAEFGEKSARRGGKRKKVYRVSLEGQYALRAAHEIRQRMWQRISPSTFQIDLSW